MTTKSTCLAWVCLLGCSSESSYLSADDRSEENYDEAAPSTFADTGTMDAAAEWEDEYEPEAENSFTRLQPAAVPDYVFVANPGRNTLSRINVQTLSVLTTEVGVLPAVVLSTPDESKAVVFNKGSDSVSVVDATSMQVGHIGIREDFNQMVMSPDGEWVICYYDEAAVDPDDPTTEGARSFNEVSLVHLDSLEHTPMVVGFNPRDIQFSSDASRAVIVSDAWLAVVNLDAETQAPNRIQISEDTVYPPEAEEVVLTPNGGQALIRQFGVTDLILVDLDDGNVVPIEVGDNPTDIDWKSNGN